MKQVLQDLASGQTRLADVPAPAVARQGVCIVTRCSMISAGTERMLVEFGRAGWLDKARQQPAKVRQVLEKVKTDGLGPTIDAVRSKLDQPLPLGYCNVGVVTAVGADVTGFTVGDRVASNGAHAEVVAVSRNLCARVPDSVSDEAAAFTVIGAIGLQGVRLAAPTLGESFVVTGLGLIGLLTVQLLRANGCRVLGIDLDPSRTALARRFGATTVEIGRGEEVIAAAEAFSRGRGVDGVIITAATTSNEPVRQAARICRKRGRIVLVGVAGLELDRADFYEKELSFQVSCSYGPGRYDPAYEERGQDYPYGLVRWTEQRNLEAMLDLMASGVIDVAPLISHRFELHDAPRAYDLLVTNEPSLGIILRYPHDDVAAKLQRAVTTTQSSPGAAKNARVAFVGAGNYAGRTLIPAFVKAGAEMHGIVSAGGVSAAHQAKKHGFRVATTDAEAVLRDASTNVAVIATRHDTHAQLVLQALACGKHVFVEKPLAIARTDVDRIEAAWRTNSQSQNMILMVGFNRRFAPQVARMKSLVDSVALPKTFIVTVNAGAIPATHWTQNPHSGGGRLIGEGCHFIDLMRYLAGEPIVSWKIATIGGGGSNNDDKATITLSFADGSIGTLHYFANGHASFPKERVEVFCGGRILQLDNFRRLTGYGWPGFTKLNLWRQDKGQNACVAAFVDAVTKGAGSPIAFDELMEVSRVVIDIGEAARC